MMVVIAGTLVTAGSNLLKCVCEERVYNQCSAIATFEKDHKGTATTGASRESKHSAADDQGQLPHLSLSASSVRKAPSPLAHSDTSWEEHVGGTSA